MDTVIRMLYSACMKILAVGSPKGGVGKTTCTFNLACTFAQAGLKVIAIDADDNQSLADWLERAEKTNSVTQVDYDTVSRPSTLRQLALIPGYDLMIIDLPGSARQGGELRALLEAGGSRDDERTSVVDLLLIPTEAADMDLRVIARVLPDIAAAGVAYEIVFSRVPPQSLAGVDRIRSDYRAAGYPIADTMIRRYQVIQDSVAMARPIILVGGGRHSQARAGEEDIRRLAREIAQRLSLDVAVPGLPDIPPPNHNPHRS